MSLGSRQVTVRWLLICPQLRGERVRAGLGWALCLEYLWGRDGNWASNPRNDTDLGLGLPNITKYFSYLHRDTFIGHINFLGAGVTQAGDHLLW